MTKPQLNIVCFLFLLLLITIASYFVFVNKEGLFLDEILSFQQANYEYVSFNEVREAILEKNVNSIIDTVLSRESDEVLTKEGFLEKCYIPNNSRAFNYFKIYAYESSNVHPPLYHFILHTVCSITQSPNIYLIGYTINLFFLLFACFLLYKVGLLIIKDAVISLNVVTLYGLSYGFLNSVTYFRMYVLLTFWIVCILYVYLKFRESNYKSEYLIPICFLHILAMFSHYYAIFYILPIFIITAISISHNNRSSLKFYLGASILSGFLFFIIWPFSILHVLFTDRGQEVQSNVFAFNSFIQILKYIRLLLRSIFGSEYLFAILVSLGVFITVKKKDFISYKSMCFEKIKNSRLLIISVPVFVYFLCAAKLSPWVSFRYISPIFPLVSLLIIMVLWHGLCLIVSDHKRKLIYLSLLSVFMAISSIVNQPIEYQYTTTEEKLSFSERYKGDTALIVNAHKMPLYGEVVLNYDHILYKRTTEGRHLPFVTNNLSGDRYLLYMDRFCNQPAIIRDLESLNFSCTQLNFKTDFHNIYLINRQTE